MYFQCDKERKKSVACEAFSVGGGGGILNILQNFAPPPKSKAFWALGEEAIAPSAPFGSHATGKSHIVAVVIICAVLIKHLFSMTHSNGYRIYLDIMTGGKIVTIVILARNEFPLCAKSKE